MGDETEKDLKDFADKQRKPVRRRDYLSLFNVTEQNERAKRIAVFLVEHPQATVREIADETNLTTEAVKQFIASNKYLHAMRFIASGKFSSLVPLALEGFRECLMSPNNEIKLKACLKVLENEQIIGPSRMEINVNDLRSQPIDKINRIIEMGQKLADQTILNAEVIQ